MSSTRIEQLINEVQAAFDRRPADIESGLDVDDAALLQLRKACRLLAGAATLQDEGYYTIVIEASFVAIERTVEFRLLERGTMQPDDLPGSHPGVYREAASAGIFAGSILIQRENPALPAKGECSDALSEPRTEQGGSESRRLRATTPRDCCLTEYPT